MISLRQAPNPHGRCGFWFADSGQRTAIVAITPEHPEGVVEWAFPFPPCGKRTFGEEPVVARRVSGDDRTATGRVAEVNLRTG